MKLDHQLKMTIECLHQADSVLNNIKTRSMWLDGLYLLLLDYDYLEQNQHLYRVFPNRLFGSFR